MRRIIATVNTTIDGYMDGPGGEADLGWLTPGRDGHDPPDEFAALMNTPQKLVLAHPGSLSEVAWGTYGNAHLVDREVEKTVRELKAQEGKDMVLLASGGLASSFLELGLVDEFQIVVVPVVLGAGKPYLRGVGKQIALELEGAKQYPKGSVRLTYSTG